MKDEIKEILEKPNVYSFNDECYLYFGDYNKLKDYITNLQEENEEIKVENEKLTQLWLNSQEKRRKAIEYLEQPYRDNFDYSKAELLNILQGEDNIQENLYKYTPEKGFRRVGDEW